MTWWWWGAFPMNTCILRDSGFKLLVNLQSQYFQHVAINSEMFGLQFIISFLSLTLKFFQTGSLESNSIRKDGCRQGGVARENPHQTQPLASWPAYFWETQSMLLHSPLPYSTQPLSWREIINGVIFSRRQLQGQK